MLWVLCKPTVPIKDEIKKIIIGDEEVALRPADLIEPELDKLRDEMNILNKMKIY